MNKLIFIILITITLSSCSIVKHVKLSIQKTNEYKSLNKYQQDFIYLTSILEDNYPHFESEIDQVVYQDEKSETLNRLNKINDDYNFKVELQRFLASFRNNHTRLGGLNSGKTDIFSSDSVLLPIKFYSYNNKWYILNISENIDKNLIGAQVISIDNLKTESLDSIVWQYISAENEYALKYEIENKKIYQKPSFYKLAGLEQTAQGFNFKFLDSNGNPVQKQIKCYKQDQIKWLIKEKDNPVTKYEKDKGYFYVLQPENNLAYLQINTFFDKPSLLAAIKNQLNPFIYPLIKIIVNNQYKKEKFGSKGMIDQVKENTESFPLFLEKMFDSVYNSNIGNLVVDLRYNNGGTPIFYSLLNFFYTDSALKDYTAEYRITSYLRKKDKKGVKNIEKGNNVKHKDNNTIIRKLRCSYDYCYDEKKFKKSQFYMKMPKQKFKGNIYIITSPASASAATVLPVILCDNNRAKVVGMPPANRPTGPTNGDIIELPNTKLPVMFSISYMTRPDTSKNNETILSIDKVIENSPDDIYEGNDRIFEWIKNDIK